MNKTSGERFMRMLKTTIGNTVLQAKYGDSAKKKIADNDVNDLTEP